MNSSGHKAIVMSTTMNYIGVGLAIDASNGKKIWTAVYIKGPGPDRRQVDDEGAGRDGRIDWRARRRSRSAGPEPTSSSRC